jgi:galactose-1-phosphate uridylyltransferase
MEYNPDAQFLTKMADGTIKQINPFTGTQVWTVPGRGNRPMTSDKEINPLEKKDPEDYCAFCQAGYLKTPPEKSRLIKTENGYKKLDRVNANELFDTTAEFRRIANLFEIISYDYWRANYDFRLSDKAKKHKEKYISTPEGKQHVSDIIDFKLHSSGLDTSEIKSISVDRKMKMANSFFAGGHELIIGSRHFMKNAKMDNENVSSGCLTPKQHFEYIKFTTDALHDIYINNRYIRYVTVFQNWLKPAGASFDHLHKQLVGIDGRSASSHREHRLVRKNPNIYNDYAVNYAAYQNLIIAENDYAIAFVDFGHRYPTLAIYSKSDRNQPWNHSKKAIKGMSDIVHACHAAMGRDIPCNEEWYYRPPDVDVSIPWHILLKWRISNPAGFEAVTKIFVNTIDPWSLRNIVVDKLLEQRANGKIEKNIKIATECDCIPNCLRYNPNIGLQKRRKTESRVHGDTLGF